jgi:hypothetical protein
VLDNLPELGPYEVRLGHTQILAAAVAGLCLPPGVTPASVMALLASAAAVSAAAPGGGADATGGSGSAAAHASNSHGAGHTYEHASAIGMGGAASSSSGMDRAASNSGTGGHASVGSGAAAAAAAAGAADSAARAAGSSAAAGGGGGGHASSGRVHTWPAIRVGLDGLGLDSTPVSRCRQCVLQLPGPLFAQLPALRAFLRQLRPLLGGAGLSAALSAADELQVLAQLLVAWGLQPEALLLEPLLTPQAEYFSGSLFQVRIAVQFFGCGNSAPVVRSLAASPSRVAVRAAAQQRHRHPACTLAAALCANDTTQHNGCPHRCCCRATRTTPARAWCTRQQWRQADAMTPCCAACGPRLLQHSCPHPAQVGRQGGMATAMWCCGVHVTHTHTHTHTHPNAAIAATPHAQAHTPNAAALNTPSHPQWV